MKHFFKQSFMILLILFCLTACNTDPYARRYEPEMDLVKVDVEERTFSYEEAMVDLPYEQMITTVCDIHDFLNYSCNTLDQVAAKIGVECLRTNDTGVYYSIHKAEQGGLLYVFYGRSTTREPGDLSVDHWFYVNEERSYADFDTIKVGSSIREVEAIDPAARLSHNEFIRSCERDPSASDGTFASQHYLNDGVLKIYYESTDDDPYDSKEGDFVICDIEYDEDYGEWKEQWNKDSYLDDVSILPQDSIAYLGQLNPPQTL